MSSRVIVVAGPTASGKTALGIAISQLAGGEIVSADSMQIYRGMNIGTAKATPEERAAAVHHMLDVAEPQESYSVARYVEEASLCCDDILSRGKLPVIVGGTGLYIDSLITGRSFSDISDSSVRNRLDGEFSVEGGDEMLRRLSAVDPERAALLNPGDRRRIVRALEVYEITGRSITAHDEYTKSLPPKYDAVRIVLNYRDRADLYSRINSRVDEMVSEGLFDEVASILSDCGGKDCTALQAIGYKEPAAALRGEISREEAVELIKLSSRRYAKRQITWFGRWSDAVRILWDKTPDLDYAIEYLKTKGVI